jgi:hypothetical protein
VVSYEVTKFRKKPAATNFEEDSPNRLPERGNQEGPENISDPFTENKASHP